MYSSNISTANETDQDQAVSPTTPTYIDKTVIQYHGNKAEIMGALHECEQFYRRTGLFRSLIEDGVVSTDKTTIVDSVQSVKFVSTLSAATSTYATWSRRSRSKCPTSARIRIRRTS